VPDAGMMTSEDSGPSYEIGNSDGGPGKWSEETIPAKGAEYQETVTGAPEGTEYVVETSLMPSGEKKFDGYDPERNVLIDAKDWSKWPAGEFLDQEINKAKNDADIAGQTGATLEWHVPTPEKALELQRIFKENRINIDVKVTPK
jgi:hypothetical protein